MKAKILLLSVILVIVFSSCEKSENEISIINGQDELLIPSTATLVEEKSTSVSDVQEIAEAEDFARLLAMSINDKDVRKFLKNEANKKFDGDYDILVSNILESKISGLSFKDQVAKSSPSGKSKGHDVISNALKNEKLNISIPLHIDNWKELKQQLLVGVAVGAIEGETEYIKAFDSKGRSYLLDANVEPDVPVIIVGDNERLNCHEEVTANEKSARVSGRAETLEFVICPKVSEIEGWFLGAPELRFDVVVYNDAFSAAYQATSKNVNFLTRDQARAGKETNIRLFYWNFDENHGPDYYIQSWEVDNKGVTQKFTVGVTAGKKDSPITGTATYELTYKEEDERLAGELIHYSNSTPYLIIDDTIIFGVSNK